MESSRTLILLFRNERNGMEGFLSEKMRRSTFSPRDAMVDGGNCEIDFNALTHFSMFYLILFYWYIFLAFLHIKGREILPKALTKELNK